MLLNGTPETVNKGTVVCVYDTKGSPCVHYENNFYLLYSLKQRSNVLAELRQVILKCLWSSFSCFTFTRNLDQWLIHSYQSRSNNVLRY